MVFSLSIGVGLDELNESTAAEAEETGSAIGGDPGTSSTVAPTSTSSGVTSTTGSPTFPINAPPDVHMPDLVMRPGETRVVIGEVTDDFSSLDSLDLTWEIDDDGLQLNGSPTVDPALDEVGFNVTALQPGEYEIELCASDGLAEDCSDADIKVTNGVVTLYEAGNEFEWYWNGSAYVLSAWIRVGVQDDWGNQVEEVTITGVIALDDGRRVTSSCTTGGDGRCWIGTNFAQPYSPGTITIIDATGPCIDGYRGLEVPIVIEDPGTLPPPPTTTTRPPRTTTTRPPRTTTTRPPTTTTTRPPATSTTTTTPTTTNTSI